MSKYSPKALFDVFIVVVLPILSALIVLLFSPDKFTATNLFFGLPILYLIWCAPRLLKKSFIFALLISIPLSVFVDTLAVYDGGWYVPDSIAPFRLFGAATFEVYWFGLLWALLAVLFYEYFFDRSNSIRFPKRYKILLIIFGVLVVWVPVAFYLNKSLLVIPFFYAWLSLVFVMPILIWFLVKFPKFLPRFTVISVYFFFLLLLFEIVALQNGLWTFPGEHFIGWVSIFGYTFPLEEFMFWTIFATPSLLAYYEFYADDLRL